MRPPLKLVVFDFDGTLVDSQHLIVACMTAAFIADGLPPPDPHDVRRIVGLPLEIGIGRLLPAFDAARHLALADGYRAAFRSSRSRPDHVETLFPGVEAMLAALAGMGLRLGIATGKSKRGLVAAMERSGLSDFFVTLQTGDIPPGKPHPAMLLRALEEADVAPAEAVMVGDTTFDIEMAVGAGVMPIGVAWGYHEPAELISAGAVHLLRSCGDLPPFLHQVLSGPCPSADDRNAG